MKFGRNHRPLSQATLTGAAIAMTVLIAASAPPEAAAAEPGAITSATTCEALGKSDLTALDSRIRSTATITRNGHTFCDVMGYISPATQFEELLPQDSWRGDYLQQGCGGLCGQANVNLDDPSRTSGYQAPYAPLANGEMVVAADDQGHEAPNNGDALWAKYDLRLRAVFGYSSEHQLAQTAKALIRIFYGRKPAYSYFSGVSDGGHEALALAQRYPEDFDGILAGAPANNWAPLTLFELWLAASNRGPQGGQILTAEKLPALHAAVMAACADDHGVISDPRACTFDPTSMRCANGDDKPDCLTDDQIRVVRDEYRGPSDREAHGLFDGGEPYGSELAWSGWSVMPAADSAAPTDTYAAQIGLGYVNYMGLLHNPRGGFSLDSVPFTSAMHQELAQLGGIYNATDPDLNAFQVHGGKIIIYHSWADQAIPPFATIDYYRAVVRQAGWPVAQSFSRLYMIPGLYHCPCGQPVDGDPATTVQFMPQLVGWVEHGEAPSTLTLPVTAQTTGSHLTSLNVEPFDPRHSVPNNNGLNSNYHYIGETGDYRPGNELWCAEDSQPLTCTTR
jgi:Tannase and feruloyl esterase